jgi:aldehyde dehydrogenase (NAD+)
LPFGGVGASGTGVHHGRYGFEALSYRRAVLTKPAKPNPRMMNPPHTDRDLRTISRFF